MQTTPSHAQNHLSSWVIASVKEPCLVNRLADEVWMLNPGVRYVLSAYQLPALEPYLDKTTELKGSALYRPLNAACNLNETRVLCARTFDRGIGDLLFMTGPMAYMRTVTAGTVKLNLYALSDRGQALLHSPLLENRTTLAGPIIYDALPNYKYHWLVDVGTEYDAEHDQLNVYDALYNQLGIDYKLIDPRFKRPYAQLSDTDRLNFDAAAMLIYQDRKFDLRKTPYYVVAPLAHGTLRSLPYSKWLELISKLQERRPVIVLGTVTDRMPATDMTAGEFMSWVDRMGRNVVNMVSHKLKLRSAMSFIANSALTFSLDSGLLYVAQAFRVPAISIWGAHHPGVRLGYDKDYMDLAVWSPELCAHAPCFAYSQFPAHLCPRREDQKVCEVFNNARLLDDVMAKVDSVEGRRVTEVVPFTLPKE